MILRHKASGKLIEHDDLTAIASGWQRPYIDSWFADHGMYVRYDSDKWEEVPEERWVSAHYWLSDEQSLQLSTRCYSPLTYKLPDRYRWVVNNGELIIQQKECC
jgi:hypothetical protein